MTSSSEQDPLGITGTTLAEKYRIDAIVGEGGFSIVYRAEHLIWRQPVAIKCFRILAQAPVDKRDELLDQFIQEGRLLASLSSRSAAIVQARDIGKFITADGQWIPYMVLEWLDGKPLEQVLFEERVSGTPARQIHDAMALLEPVIIALEIAHAKNIAHRDIKPANIFVVGDPSSPTPFTKVLDFGIAKVMADHAAESSAAAKTGTEITAFTPNYGAPEQFSRSHGATGPWTDVFAMALILVEILRGGVPAFEGNDIMHFAVASRDPSRRPTPRTFGVPVSPEVEAVFAKALAVSPNDRFASMGQFWAALHRAVFPDTTWNPGTTSGIWAPGAFAGAGTSSGSFASFAPSRPSIPHSPAAPSRLSNGGTIPIQSLGGAVPNPGARPQVSTPMTQVPTEPGFGNQKRGAGLFIAIVAVTAVILVGGGLAVYKFLNPNPTPTQPVASVSVPPSAAPSAVNSAVARPTECPAGMVLVPGGKFFMGSDEPDFKLWQPAHKTIVDTFCIDMHEVTAAEYKTCSDQGECKRPPELPNWPKTTGTSDAEHEKKRAAYGELCNFGKPDRENHPINCVSFYLAESYCSFKKKRLPTEAEWEFAARGSDGRKFPWGDDPGAAERMNAGGTEFTRWEKKHGLPTSPVLYEMDDGFEGTAPVGSFPKGKTRFGADDFIGNVWEWTGDWFETYKPDEVINPKGAPNGDRKAIRGGAFNGGNLLWLKPAFRFHQVPDATTPVIGFRCVANL
jgi:eukaryotic-like serine/threonine-protein kinase